MIIRARVVVPIDRPIIENGAVAISGNRIVAIGKFDEVKAAGTERGPHKIVDLGEQALLPGLINAHCHLDYTYLRGKIPRLNSFTDWIRAINAAKAKLSSDDYIASIKDGFAEAKRFGTTTIANLTAVPELIAQIPETIRTWWFPELIDVRQEISVENLNALNSQASKAASHWGLAPHAPFTASRNLYRRCQTIAQREKILLTTHLAESADEMEMFRAASGPLYDFLKEIGRDMSDCGTATPVSRFFEMTGASPNHPQAIEVNRPYLLTHLNELTEDDFGLLHESRLSVVHCPRSHEYFSHSPFQFEKLKRLGLNISLGTDSLASNHNLSLFAEMRHFQKRFPNTAPKEILSMVTTNSARALGEESVLGKIAPGFLADLIALPCNTTSYALEEIIAFDGAIKWSMIAGAPQNG